MEELITFFRFAEVAKMFVKTKNKRKCSKNK